MSERVASVPIHLLFVRDQKHRLKQDIQSLVESLLKIGQINPITVVKEGDEYRVIAGRRRYAALTYIQEELKPEQEIKAQVSIKDISGLEEELIKIDENIIRKQLGDIEFDEAIFRRKQIYEELHPETRKDVAGGLAKGRKSQQDAGKAPKGKGQPARPAFTKDAATKLNVTRRTIEKAVSRAAKASEAVKKARAGGLLQSKVDLLVMLDTDEQDMLLPLVKKMDLADTKAIIQTAIKKGAKSAVIYYEEEAHQDPALKPLLRDASRVSDILKDANNEGRVLRGATRHDDLKMLEELQKRLQKFIETQRSRLGYVRAISKTESGGRRFLRAART